MIGLLDARAGYFFLGVLGLLVLASLLAAALSWRASRAGEVGPALVNLNQRIAAWWLMCAVLAGALALGETATLVLFLALSFLALREFLTILPTHRADHNALVWLVFIIAPLNYWFLWEHWYGAFSVLIPVYAFLFLPARNAMSGQSDGFLMRAATIQWALMVCVYAISYIPAVMQLPVAMHLGREAADGAPVGSGGAEGARLMLFLVVVVQGSDVLQYVWGKTLGRHAVAPTISPHKTWEGLVGGVLSATVLGAALAWLTPFAWWQAGLLALVSCIMGFAGGLVMSAIKRDRGIKDFGATIAGHGGIMDRLDSLCFAAPVFFHLVRFFFT